MKKLKRFIAVLLIALCTGQTSVEASGIPVVDASAIAQMVQQLLQLQQMYSQLQAQYNTAVAQLNNFTGSRGLGLIDYNLNWRNLIPAEAHSRLNSIINGTGALSNLGQSIYDKFNLGNLCQNTEGSAKTSCLNMQKFRAESSAVLQEAQNVVNLRLQNIESLMSRINTATDAKSIADLSARIQAEQVALNASQFAAQFQQAQMKQQEAALEALAEQKAMEEAFPFMTEADIAKALKPLQK